MKFKSAKEGPFRLEKKNSKLLNNPNIPNSDCINKAKAGKEVDIPKKPPQGIKKFNHLDEGIARIHYKHSGSVLRRQDKKAELFDCSAEKRRKGENSSYNLTNSQWPQRGDASRIKSEPKRKLHRARKIAKLSTSSMVDDLKKDNAWQCRASEKIFVKNSSSKLSASQGQTAHIFRDDMSYNAPGHLVVANNTAEESCSSVSSCESFAVRDYENSLQDGSRVNLTDTSDDESRQCQPFKDKDCNGILLSKGHNDSVHNLETMAYKSVLHAFHARGPLDWRQEALLTDLRLSLHISNDEHRSVLAQMCSARNVHL